jgi:uncharacterized protein with HEPN domain
MSKTPRAHLQDMLTYLDKALSFTQSGREVFFADEMAQMAVIRVYEVIGEIVKRLPADIRESNPQIDWRKLAGFRDFLSHNYDEIIVAFVWQAVEDLPILRSALLELIGHLPVDE